MTVLARRLNLLFWGISFVVLLAAAGWGVHLFRLQREAERTAARSAVEKGRTLLSDLQAHLPQEGALAEAGDRLARAEARLAKGESAEARREAEAALLLLEPLKGRLEAPGPTARILAGEGTLEANGEGRAAKEGEEIPLGSAVKAGPSGLLLHLPAGQLLALGPRAGARVLPGAEEGGPVAEIAAGGFWAFAPASVRRGQGLVLRSPNGEVELMPGAAVEGEAGGGRLLLEVHRDAVTLRGSSGERTVSAGLRTARLRLTPSGEESLEPRTAAPAPESPLSGAVLWAEGPSGAAVELRWEASAASRVGVQVSRSPLFEGAPLRQAEVEKLRLPLGTLPAGRYFWRLRALGPSPGPWTPPLAFRILLPSADPPPADWRLDVDATPLGDAAVVRGTVKPRREVAVNGVEVPVGDGGEFTGTFPFQKGREVEVIAFDEQGRRTVWRRAFP